MIIHGFLSVVRKLNMRVWIVLWMVLGFLWTHLSVANVVITGTRIIYPAQNKEVGIELTNVEDTPALLQAWIAPANENSATSVPFVLMPPIFRMEGNTRQTLRLIHTHEPLATDRETLFYFNLLDIPPTPKVDGDAQNYLQFSLLSKLKLFYRPKNLKPSIEKAPSMLQVSRHHNQLVIKNPTPYYMTLLSLSLHAHKDDPDVIARSDDVPMIEPFGEDIVEVQGVDEALLHKANTAQVEIVNDYGGRVAIMLNLGR